uniref:beta-lactamase n=1 Tax=uncultured organism TaxID=155900 RepID=A0A8A1V8W1_9ZZZZ|nr:ceftazidime resistance protein [uncultured organism]
MLCKVIVCCFFVFSLCSLSQAQDNEKIQLADDVFVEKITDHVWRHVSSKNVPNFGLVPSNGVIAQFGTDILLIDSAWNDAQTKLVLDWIEKELKAKPAVAVITHAHDDRIGGIHEIHRRGIRTLSSALTAELAKQQGIEVPQQTFDETLTLTLGRREVLVRYPGPGHTRDNIVVWLPDQEILVGGCLIKSTQAKNIGNTKDADLAQWPKTIEKIQQEFKQVKIVVPGHDDPSGVEAMTRTLELLRNVAQRK